MLNDSTRFARRCLVLAAILGLTVPATTAAGQGAAVQRLDRPLRVLVDCRTRGCDQDFFLAQLVWVDHVRDQRDADVHVLVTGQDTGGGGTEYTIRFIGRGQWNGQEDTLLRNTEAIETDDSRRRALVQAFALGLARFAAATPIGTALRVEAASAAVSGLQTAPADDPWNFWVFRTNFNTFLNGEATSKFTNININQSANRTTADWKLNVGTGVNYNEGEYDLTEGEVFRSFRRGWNVNGLAVKSLGEHWSIGGKAGASRSSFLNQRLNVRVAPGLEFNVFPYGESTERQFTLQWTAGVNRFVYDEITIFGKTRESKWNQTLMSFLNFRQPFGTVSLTIEGAHYFDDVGKFRLAMFADNELRITRGLSLRLDGSYQIIHDQLYLPLGGASDEEIIARQCQLATSYRYFVSMGFTYRFGSINNNVVNPRFGGGGRFF